MRGRAYRRHQATRATARAVRRVHSDFGLCVGEFHSPEDIARQVNSYTRDRCPHRAQPRRRQTRATMRASINLREQMNEL